MIKASKKVKTLLGYNPRKVLNEIQQIVLDQQNKVIAAYEDIVKGLARKEIYIIDEKSLNREQKNFVRNYFKLIRLADFNNVSRSVNWFIR